jgi:hypothetical protein
MNVVILGILTKVTIVAPQFLMVGAVGLLFSLIRAMANRPKPIRQRVVIVPSIHEERARIQTGRLVSSPSRAPPGVTGIPLSGLDPEEIPARRL